MDTETVIFGKNKFDGWDGDFLLTFGRSMYVFIFLRQANMFNMHRNFRLTIKYYFKKRSFRRGRIRSTRQYSTIFIYRLSNLRMKQTFSRSSYCNNQIFQISIADISNINSSAKSEVQVSS